MSSVFLKTENKYNILKSNLNTNEKDGLRDWKTDKMLDLRP